MYSPSDVIIKVGDREIKGVKCATRTLEEEIINHLNGKEIEVRNNYIGHDLIGEDTKITNCKGNAEVTFNATFISEEYGWSKYRLEVG